MSRLEPPEALFWERTGTGATVRCGLCGHRCTIREGLRGICRVRENRGGRLVALAWGRLLAVNADPIEKQPLSHFLPGTLSLSIASAGCNLRCAWCQNDSMSEAVRRDGGRIRGALVRPEEVVEQAVARRCASISYTYSEPTVHYEHNRAVGVLARARGLKNVFVTNGLMTPEAARDAAGAFLDAANVDLKAMRPRTYRRLCKGPLDAVLESIRTLHSAGVWLEVTTLVVPGVNDDEDELRDAARFLTSVSPDLPWHLSRYHPANRWLGSPPTPVATLRRAREIGLEAGLRYVYTGNVQGEDGAHTYCPSCTALVVRRRGFVSEPVALAGGRCARCGAGIAGVGMGLL